MSSIGKRRHLGQLERPEKTASGRYGGSQGATAWVAVARVYAKRTNTLRATAESIASGGQVAAEQVRWDIRARPVDAGWRFVVNGVVYDIKSVGPGNGNDEVALLTVSGASNG